MKGNEFRCVRSGTLCAWCKATLKPIAAPSGHALSHADLLADAC